MIFAYTIKNLYSKQITNTLKYLLFFDFIHSFMGLYLPFAAAAAPISSASAAISWMLEYSLCKVFFSTSVDVAVTVEVVVFFFSKQIKRVTFCLYYINIVDMYVFRCVYCIYVSFIFINSFSLETFWLLSRQFATPFNGFDSFIFFCSLVYSFVCQASRQNK